MLALFEATDAHPIVPQQMVVAFSVERLHRVRALPHALLATRPAGALARRRVGLRTRTAALTRSP
jgi:hypothetical protein